MYSGGTKEGEFKRSAELIVELTKEKGVYYAIAFLYDIEYTREDISRVLGYLEKESGERRNNF